MNHSELDVIWDVLEGLAQGLDLTYDNQRRLAKSNTKKPEKTIRESIQEARKYAEENCR